MGSLGTNRPLLATLGLWAVALAGCQGEAHEVASAGITTVELAPSFELAAVGVAGVPNGTDLVQNVDDGVSAGAADDAGSFVGGRAGVALGRHTVGYAGAPEGRVTAVVVHTRAQRGDARKGALQVRLYDGDSLVGTGARHSLPNRWTNMADRFDGLAVASASQLRTEVSLTNSSPSARGAVRYTQVWISAELDVCSPTTCAIVQECGVVPDGCGGVLDCGACPDQDPPDDGGVPPDGTELVCAELKAFPTAEGFGAQAVGGRGGRVFEITSLGDSGPGTLRECIEGAGPRTCVFRVSGTIELASDLRMRGEAGSFITIAGQSSPGGVQLKGYGMMVMDGAHDVIVRHLRIRPGAHLPALGDTNGFIAWGNDGTTVHDIIVDHCSLEWSTDQNGPDAWHAATRYTSQWNLIAEGTTEGHEGGSHSMGVLVGAASADEPITLSLHHSVFAHNGGRNPLISSATVVDFRNNVVYNWGGNNAAEWGNFGEGTEAGAGTAFGNIVNNHYISGADSGMPYFWVSNGGPIRLDGAPAERGGTRVYTDGNWGPNCPAGCPDDWSNVFLNIDYWRWDGRSYFPEADPAQFRANQPFQAPSVTTTPTGELVAVVLPTVGASRPSRDALDARIVEDVRNGSGRISDVGSGGPWPTLVGPRAPDDQDHDGMADDWERGRGLDPTRSADGAADHDGNGYTELEDYLNQLAGDPTCQVR